MRLVRTSCIPLPGNVHSEVIKPRVSPKTQPWVIHMLMHSQAGDICSNCEGGELSKFRKCIHLNNEK